MFHPLVTPLTTYMYSTDIQHNGTVSASDAERLPPGGFSLRHGFGAWFGRGSRATTAAAHLGEGVRSASGGTTVMTPPRAVATATGTTPGSVASAAASEASAPGFAQTWRREVSTYEVLRYIRSAFDDEDVLDAVPLEAAGNPGAWHAWRTHRRLPAGKALSGQGEGAAATTRRPEEWNWEGVWEERVKRGTAASLSEGVLFGTAGGVDEVVCLSFLLTWFQTNVDMRLLMVCRSTSSVWMTPTLKQQNQTCSVRLVLRPSTGPFLPTSYRLADTIDGDEGCAFLEVEALPGAAEPNLLVWLEACLFY
jgi:hypothetical protein